MQKSSKVLFVSLILLFATSIAYSGEYSPAFPDYLADHQNDAMVSAIITMADQVNLRTLQDDLYARHADRREWHEAVVRALQEKATLTQADIIARLDQMGASGMVAKYKSLWIGNIVVVSATREALDELVSRDDVARVSPDYYIEEIEPVSKGGDEPAIAGHEIGLERIHADQCWAMGITGDGRMVSHLDTGVDGNHPALNARWRGYDPRYVNNPEWAWFDPVTNTDFPFDSGAHGTHTMGTMCGLGEGTGDTVGVAFGAQWISAGVIDRVSIPRTVQDALAAFEWVTDPDLDPGTVWDVPDVCSNSWGVLDAHGYPPCDETFWVVLDGCEAAGIVVCFAAGNEGPGAYSLRRPADRATTDLTSFSVGAVDGNNQNLPIADFSSRGPSNCTPNGDDTIKPEVSAPGVNVRSSVPGGGYQGGWSGTSMACPHVAGVVALMRQANPNLTSEQIRQIFLDTAFDRGDPGEDNDYGMGVINAYDAVLVAISLLQGWGTQGGVITDQASGNPIQGASISVQGRPWHATSRGNGEYYLTVPADTAWIIKVDHPPVHLPVFDTIMVVENDTIFQNYALEGKVPVTLTASFGNPVDASYRSFYFKGSWNSDGFWDNSWSAPLMEVKDDGVFPDQTANDGVFTGRVLLARDLAHTYSWAIYSENYGGESARLQYGANFSIPDLNPPTVPTMSVNPCGTDHDWNISVYGNGGALQLDLHRGFNSHPQKWGAAESLFAGNTYTLFFRPMHCDAGQYGVGGIGGAAYVFDCTFTGAYDFIFDDRDDGGIIQLVGTDGPPVYLSARSGLDGHIPVAWLPPGTQESQELLYDDGTLMNGYYYFDPSNLMAEMFEPAEHPVVIDSVLIHILTEGDQFWPWPDGQHDPVGISIFLDDGTGFPEPDPVFYTEATCNLGEWLRVDVEEVLVESGNFWVALNNLAGDGDDGMGLDAFTDYPGNKWAREFGSWMLQDYYTGDHMIRSKVFGGGRAAWLGYDAGIAGEVNLDVPVASHPALVGGSGHANEVLSAAKSMGVNRMAYHPKASPIQPPMILDQEVDGYRLYRSTSPNPYSGGEGNLVNCPLIPDDIILPTNYDDWSRCNFVDSIQNGVQYFYEASAIYGVGGGAYIELGPSNQDTAMAQNHPPANPVNLTGYSVLNDVYLTWNRNTDYDIMSYRVFRRDYNQQNFNLVGTVAHPETTFHDNITIDGIYRYKIAAVDDGDMQSTGFSNSVDIPIGAIPPRNLQATTDEEFQISLRWQHPGGGGGGDLTVLVIAADEAGMFINELLAFDDVVQVDYFDGRSGTPDLDFLSTYNVVIVWSNYVFSDPYGMGDVLADYVDAGGGVVLQQFCFGSGWGLGGRIMDEYASFSQGPTSYQMKCLGEYDPAHPIMEGVSEACDIYSANVSLVNNGELVASYEDGTPFVGVSPDVNVVCVNAYIGDARQFTGDMIILVHNALNFATGGAVVIPQNYILYKSDSPSGPFAPLDTLPGEQRNYVDAPVPNGVDYWYQLTAVYPGPDESDPSNTALGRAQNYPPAPPFGLHGTVDNRDISIQWSFTNTMGDWDHFTIYKKLVPGGSFTFVASTTDSSAVITIPPGEDGVYGVVVRAVDNGAPQLESGNSNQVFFPVGNLPPNSLRATSDLEFHVPLHWSEPGMRPTVTISYDDGTVANGYYYFDYDNIIANHFEAVSPVEIETLWVHVLTEGDAFWPWPDGQHDPVGVSVFDDDGGGNPGDQVFYTEVTCELGQWISVPIEGGLTINGPNFWVGFNNLAGGGEDGMGLDLNTDFPEHKWAREFGSWFMQDYYPGDHMIRATIIDNGRSLTLGETAPTLRLAEQQTAPPSEMLAATPRAARFDYSIPPSLTLDRRLGFNDSPRPLDTEVLLGYRVYKDTAPNVPRDVGHRIRDYPQQGLVTTYDDSAVVNGTTYFYVVTAMYDNDGNIEESPPSNEAAGLPANHPPEAPSGLYGSVNNRDVTLHWSFTNINRDLDHFNVYKKIIPGGTFAFVMSSPVDSAVVNIPPGEDGVWAFVVTAVDNGTPQLESGYSNQVYFPVGNLPPVNLRATSNMEGYVPLRWSEPGIRPTVTVGYDDGVLVNGYYYYDYTYLMANQFTVAPPVEVETLWVHVLTEGDAWWPWPDGQHDPVGISVFDDDGGGYPGDQVYYTEVTCELGQWIMIPIENGLQLNGPSFWIALNNLSGGGEDGIGIDMFTDYPEYKWAYEGSWFNQDYYPGDHMVRATVIDNGRSILLSEKSPTKELALANGEPADDMRATATKAVPAAPSITSVDGGIRIDDPRPLDIEVDGYNVYRALAPNVPVDSGHRVRNWQVQPGTAWNDSGVVNGTYYYYVVTAVYNGGADESPASNEVVARPMVGARMVLNPLSFNVSGMPGHVGSANLNIANPGGLDLNFGIVAQTDLRGHVSQSRPNWTFEAMNRSRVYEFDKSNVQQGPSNPPMLLGRGGPDEYGYIWIDSDEPGGPVYEWEDIVGIGEQLPMTDDDQNLGPYDLGFAINFYGNIFSTINICSNGWISFTSTSGQYGNFPLPDPGAPENMIAPFWDDLYPPYGGEYWFYSDGAHAVISFINVPHIGEGGPYTFQVIVTPNGAIRCNYMEINYPDDSETIGIQNGDGTIGLTVVSDQTYIHNEMTILFIAGWLSADPASGVVTPGGNSNVSIIFDASFLDIGVYTGTLIVTGTDMNHQVGVVDIPVTFHVVPDVVDEPSDNLPKEFALSQNYPNPFNPTTEIEFALPVNSRVNLDVFNVLGQKVRTLVNGDMEAGYKSVVWNGTDNAGASVASGTYFYVLKTGDKTFTKKMTMLK